MYPNRYYSNLYCQGEGLFHKDYRLYEEMQCRLQFAKDVILFVIVTWMTSSSKNFLLVLGNLVTKQTNFDNRPTP